jgi:hypothetical protein
MLQGECLPVQRVFGLRPIVLVSQANQTATRTAARDAETNQSKFLMMNKLWRNWILSLTNAIMSATNSPWDLFKKKSPFSPSCKCVPESREVVKRLAKTWGRIGIGIRIGIGTGRNTPLYPP